MNRIKLLLVAIILSAYQYASEEALWTEITNAPDIVKSTIQLQFKDFPDAFNPSIFKMDQGYLLSFRYCPDRDLRDQLSYIGVVLLDESLHPISEPQLLNTRSTNDKTLSQAEDARIFSYKGRIFVIFNDNVEVNFPSALGRRDMFIAELYYKDNEFTLSSSLKLIHEEKYNSQLWQKNWVPFEWKNKLLITYTISPHEIVSPNLLHGTCYTHHITNPKLDWGWGVLRGSTPPLLVDGEYLAFFHSVTKKSTEYVSYFQYFMGAYTFSAEPPFKLTKISPFPISSKEFYSDSHTPLFKLASNYQKKVIFPGGVAISGSNIYVAYGKDDSEIWIATLNKEALMKSLVKVE